jgi:hypothetical protein
MHAAICRKLASVLERGVLANVTWHAGFKTSAYAGTLLVGLTPDISLLLLLLVCVPTSGHLYHALHTWEQEAWWRLQQQPLRHHQQLIQSVD